MLRFRSWISAFGKLTMIELLLLAALGQQKPPTTQDLKQKGADLDRVFSQVSRPQPGDKLWKPSKLTVDQLAKKVEAAVRSLKNTEVTVNMLAQTAEGRGQFDGIMRIGDNRHYRIDTFVVKSEPVTAIYVNNGKSRFVLYDGQFVPKNGMPAASRHPSATADPKKLVSIFPSEFGRVMFQGLMDGLDSWAPIFNAWKSGAAGYKVKMEERVMAYQGQKYLTYRLRATRGGAAVKKLGKSEIEVSVDGARFLPVTVKEMRVDLKKKPWITHWAGLYKFNKKFSQADYAITSQPGK